MELKPQKELDFARKQQVLIVPYGIETHVGLTLSICLQSVNCTLWN